VGVRDRDGWTALHHAAFCNDVAAAKERLAAGDDPSVGDRQGFTPLHFAAQEWSLEVASLLLDGGARVDKPNSYGNTPLFTAVFNSRGRGELIAFLRAHGADPHHPNTTGQTPLGLARLIANYDVARHFDDIEGSG
jgi:hypothetical protein